MADDSSRAWKDQYMLRFPDGMRDRLKKEAAENGRSLNAEIIFRLQTTLEMDDYLPVEGAHPDEPYPYEDNVALLLKDMDERYQRILEEVRAINDRYEADLRARLSKAGAAPHETPPSDNLPSFIRTDPSEPEKARGNVRRRFGHGFLHTPPKPKSGDPD
ncbi:Arc family DNA-binding protein [Ancylobacter sp. VNQ12]|uniref:Arc family DNA-binding protein n=1 Tax=Ancylobacter sp. VNQ12 TaxID=3400920 RepID=UPI003C0D4CE0